MMRQSPMGRVKRQTKRWFVCPYAGFKMRVLVGQIFFFLFFPLFLLIKFSNVIPSFNVFLSGGHRPKLEMCATMTVSLNSMLWSMDL